MTETASPSAFLLRRRLRRELAQARQEAGLTQAQAAERLGVSVSTVIRAEGGGTRISVKDARAFSEIYGVSDRADHLAELARRSARLPWREYSSLVDRAELEFVGHEAMAHLLRSYQSGVVPGLLQTPAYTRALMRTAKTFDDESIEKIVTLRKERQQFARLSTDRGFVFIMDEAVLHRRVGSRDVQAAQLEALLNERNPMFDLYIMPFEAGPHFGVRGSFVLLEFEESDDDDVLYIESSLGPMIIRDRPNQLALFRSGFSAMLRSAASTERARALIGDVLRKLRVDATA